MQQAGVRKSDGAPIEPIVRALNVLEVLNRKPVNSLGELHAATGLPKPTLVRLLDTLIAAGYAARIAGRGGYRITEQVRTLSGGLRFVDRIVDAAIEPMSRFTRDHGWPLALGKVREGAVVLLHSTIPESPLSFEQAGYNRTYPLALSALGQAYLAFCPAEERRRLIRELRGSAEIGLVVVGDTRTIEAYLAAVRRRGYAVTTTARPSTVLGLAVPVLQGANVAACLTMRFPRSVMTPEQAAGRHLAALTATARAIVAALDAPGGAG